MANPNETIYTDPARGVISYATSAKLAINIQGVELSEDVLRINFTDSVTGTFDSETGTATIPITPGAQQATQWTITGRISSGVGILENFDISTLEDDTEPSDIELLGQRTGDGNLVKVGVGNLPTGGGGEANLGSNVGVGFGTFDNKSGVTLNMRSINPLNLFEGAINAQSIELDFKDTSQLAFVGRADAGSGKPTFVQATNPIFQEAFQSNLPKVVISTSRPLAQLTDYKRLVDIDNDAGTVTLTLPDPAGAQFTGFEPGHFCDIRVRSGANIASITTAVSGNFRHQNGYKSPINTGLEDTIFLGYVRNRAIGQVYRLYRETDRWLMEGDYRTVETDDLTLNTMPVISSEDTLSARMQFAVVSALPGSPDPATVYFVV